MYLEEKVMLSAWPNYYAPRVTLMYHRTSDTKTIALSVIPGDYNGIH